MIIYIYKYMYIYIYSYFLVVYSQIFYEFTNIFLCLFYQLWQKVCEFVNVIFSSSNLCYVFRNYVTRYTQI